MINCIEWIKCRYSRPKPLLCCFVCVVREQERGVAKFRRSASDPNRKRLFEWILSSCRKLRHLQLIPPLWWESRLQLQPFTIFMFPSTRRILILYWSQRRLSLSEDKIHSREWEIFLCRRRRTKVNWFRTGFCVSTFTRPIEKARSDSLFQLRQRLSENFIHLWYFSIQNELNFRFWLWRCVRWEWNRKRLGWDQVCLVFQSIDRLPSSNSCC